MAARLFTNCSCRFAWAVTFRPHRGKKSFAPCCPTARHGSSKLSTRFVMQGPPTSTCWERGVGHVGSNRQFLGSSPDATLCVIIVVVPGKLQRRSATGSGARNQFERARSLVVLFSDSPLSSIASSTSESAGSPNSVSQVRPLCSSRSRMNSCFAISSGTSIEGGIS
jgi:hypothetical protein